jgi:hypothetical protein
VQLDATVMQKCRNSRKSYRKLWKIKENHEVRVATAKKRYEEISFMDKILGH